MPGLYRELEGWGLQPGPMGDGIRETTNQVRDPNWTNEGTGNLGSEDLSNGGLKD